MKKTTTWTNAVDKLFMDRNLHPTQNGNQQIIVEFYQTFVESGFYHHSVHGDGYEMMNILGDASKLAEFPTVNVRTTVYDLIYNLIPALSNNKTFLALIPRLIKVKSKGKGIGELALTLICRNGKFDSQHDTLIGDRCIEVKKSTGGSLKATDESQWRAVDVASENYFDGLNIVNLQFRKKRNEYFAQFSKDEIYGKVFGFINDVYPSVPENTRLEWIAFFAENINDVGALRDYIGREMCKVYKSIEDFSTLVLISPDGGLDMVIINDANDVDFMIQNTKFEPKFYRGGDNQGCGDGFVNISIKEIKKEKIKYLTGDRYV